MHTKTMEGLIGARTNMDMTNGPMRVFKEARRKGATATMERAMGYVNDFEDKAFAYKDKAEEGMEEEAKEAREKQKKELEEAIEKRREERKKAEEQREALRNGTQTSDAPQETQAVENISGTSQTEEPSNPADSLPQKPKADSVEISPEGSALSSQSGTTPAANLPDAPVFYSSSGAAERISAAENGGMKVDVSI